MTLKKIFNIPKQKFLPILPHSSVSRVDKLSDSLMQEFVESCIKYSHTTGNTYHKENFIQPDINDSNIISQWNRITSLFDPHMIPIEIYPRPSQEDICKLVMNRRHGESIMFAFRFRFFTVTDFYFSKNQFNNAVASESTVTREWTDSQNVKITKEDLMDKILFSIERSKTKASSNIVVSGLTFKPVRDQLIILPAVTIKRSL